VRSQEKSETRALQVSSLPSRGCKQELVLIVEMSSPYESSLNIKGSITYKFDDEPLVFNKVSFLADKDYRYLRISLNTLKEGILKKNNLIIRVDSHIGGYKANDGSTHPR
jgi:hypothetical protein